MILFGKRQLVDLFILIISFGNSCYLMPNKPRSKVLFYAQDPHSTFALSRMSADITFHCFLLQVRPKGAAASDSPVMTTWRCGRTSHVPPGEWLGQRKTSDRPWKKLALRSVSGEFKGCITVNLLYLKSLSTAKPCEINSHWNRECSSTATWGKQNTHRKLEKVLKIISSVLLGKQTPFSCGKPGRQAVKRVPWLQREFPFAKQKVHLYSWLLGAVGIKPLELVWTSLAQVWQTPFALLEELIYSCPRGNTANSI